MAANLVPGLARQQAIPKNDPGDDESSASPSAKVELFDSSASQTNGEDSYADTVRLTVQKINGAVDNLYAVPDSHAASSPKSPPSPARRTKDGNQDTMDLPESDDENTIEDQKDDNHEREDEDYDFKAAGEDINDYLARLKIVERTKVMQELNDWYSERAARVDQDLHILYDVEQEFKARDESMKDGTLDMLAGFEKKTMREVSVLLQFQKTLVAGSKRGRARFASPTAADFSTRKTNSQKNFMGLKLQSELERCGAPSELAEVLRTEDAPCEAGHAIDDPFDIESGRRLLRDLMELPSRATASNQKASDLLEIVHVVHERQRELKLRSEMCSKHVELMQAAMNHLAASDGTGQTSQAIEELITQVRDQAFQGNEDGSAPDVQDIVMENKDLQELIESHQKDMELRIKTLEAKQTEQKIREQEKSYLQKKKGKAEKRTGNKGPRTGSKGPVSKGPRTASKGSKEPPIRASESDAGSERPETPGSEAPERPSLPSSDLMFHTNHQALLNDTEVQVKEKEQQLREAREKYQEVQKEFHLFRYCDYISECGIDIIMHGFNPDEAIEPIEGIIDPEAVQLSVNVSDTGKRKSRGSLQSVSEEVTVPRVSRNTLNPRITQGGSVRQTVMDAAMPKADKKNSTVAMQEEIAAMEEECADLDIKVKAERADVKNMEIEFARMQKEFDNLLAQSRARMGRANVSKIEKQLTESIEEEEKLRFEVALLKGELHGDRQSANLDSLKGSPNAVEAGTSDPAKSLEPGPLSLHGVKFSTESGEAAQRPELMTRKPSSETAGNHAADEHSGPPINATLSLEMPSIGLKKIGKSREVQEMVKVQQCCDDLKHEIEDLIHKTAAIKDLLKIARKKQERDSLDQATVKRILGIPPDQEELKPPPEYFYLKKAVKDKHKMVSDLRHKWATQRKDFENLLEKATDGKDLDLDSSPSPDEEFDANDPAGDTPPWVRGLIAGRINSKERQSERQSKRQSDKFSFQVEGVVNAGSERTVPSDRLTVASDKLAVPSDRSYQPGGRATYYKGLDLFFSSSSFDSSDERPSIKDQGLKAGRTTMGLGQVLSRRGVVANRQTAQPAPGRRYSTVRKQITKAMTGNDDASGRTKRKSFMDFFLEEVRPSEDSDVDGSGDDEGEESEEEEVEIEECELEEQEGVSFKPGRTAR